LGFENEQILEWNKKRITKDMKTLIHLSIKPIAIFMSLYHIYCIVGGRIEPYFYRFTHLCMALLLGLLVSALKKEGHNRLFSLILGITTIFLYIYFYLNYERLLVLVPGLHVLTIWDKVIGILLIFLILEGARRYIGWLLSLISIFFLIYIFSLRL